MFCHLASYKYKEKPNLYKQVLISEETKSNGTRLKSQTGIRKSIIREWKHNYISTLLVNRELSSNTTRVNYMKGAESDCFTSDFGDGPYLNTGAPQLPSDTHCMVDIIITL